jgi:hypothetical protein
VQRFGGGLNLNVHFHTLALDGGVRPVPGRAACVLPGVGSRATPRWSRCSARSGDEWSGSCTVAASSPEKIAGAQGSARRGVPGARRIVGASVQGRAALDARAGAPCAGSAGGCARRT